MNNNELEIGIDNISDDKPADTETTDVKSKNDESASVEFTDTAFADTELLYDEKLDEELDEELDEDLQSEQTRPRMLFIDADACPVTREALEIARKAKVPVTIVGNSTQNLARHIRPGYPASAEEARTKSKDPWHPGFWVETLAVSCGADSADFAIVERLRPRDIVVTQDIGLASMALGRAAYAIGVRGRIYDKATIDMQLFIRHEEKKERRRGGRTTGPAAFTGEDRSRFKRNLKALLDKD